MIPDKSLALSIPCRRQRLLPRRTPIARTDENSEHALTRAPERLIGGLSVDSARRRTNGTASPRTPELAAGSASARLAQTHGGDCPFERCRRRRNRRRDRAAAKHRNPALSCPRTPTGAGSAGMRCTKSIADPCAQDLDRPLPMSAQRHTAGINTVDMHSLQGAEASAFRPDPTRCDSRRYATMSPSQTGTSFRSTYLHWRDSPRRRPALSSVACLRNSAALCRRSGHSIQEVKPDGGLRFR